MMDFDRLGFSVHEHVLAAELRERLLVAFANLPGRGAGDRAGLLRPAVVDLARTPAVRALVEPLLGEQAFAFRATLFDKTRASNWPVAWHQDRVIAVAEQVPADGFTNWGFTNWSQKPDGLHVEPPLSVQTQVLAVRVDLDGSGPHNGGLRLIAGSHRGGILDVSAIADAVQHGDEHCPEIVAGGALRMRPLLLHASRRANVDGTATVGHRRIVHFEFAAGVLPGGVRFRQRVHLRAE